MAFFVVPSAVAFIALGDIVAAALLQTGRFRYEDAVYVWAILAGSAFGLLPATFARLYSSTSYALKDTRTPLRYALVHVAIATVLGYLLAIPVSQWIGLPAQWGAVGLTLSAGLAAWVEMLLLRRALNARIGPTGLPARHVVILWGGASLAAGAAWTIRLMLPALHPALIGLLVLGPYGAAYFGLTLALGVPESGAVIRRLVMIVSRRGSPSRSA
jgi:putative peptidoglycan lipid II flippase